MATTIHVTRNFEPDLDRQLRALNLLLKLPDAKSPTPAADFSYEVAAGKRDDSAQDLKNVLASPE